MEGFKNWREVRDERPLNEGRVNAFRLLIENQHRIAEALRPYGVSDDQIDAALELAERALPTEPDDHRGFYLDALALYVEALDGGIESGSGGLVAAFSDVRVPLDSPYFDPPSNGEAPKVS